MSELSDSEFAKWRCLVSMVHADGCIAKEEINVLKMQFRKVPFTPQQLNRLNQDLVEPKDFEKIYGLITDSEDRKDLVQLAYTMFWSDSEFHETEEKIFKFLKDNAN